MATAASVRDKAFRIVQRPSWRTGAVSWVVTGALRGRRIRESFKTRLAAEARRLELDAERLGQQSPEVLRATWLTPEQVKAAEWIFYRMPEPDEARRAIDWWQRQGKAQSDLTAHASDVRLDDARAAFERYLQTAENLREATRRNLSYRVAMFAADLGNPRLAEITPEHIETWLDSRKTKAKASAVTRDNDRRAISRFFQWCIQRPQRFLVANPVREVRVAQPERAAPEIYAPSEVMRLLVAARRFRQGRFLKFIVLQLFGSMRPTEALRYRDERLVGGQIRIEGKDSKTGRARTIDAGPLLLAWLRVCGEGPVADPQKSKLLWGQLKAKAKLTRWIADGLRHTSISHYFRRCGEYGITAEHCGNSEAIIRAHYQARTTAEETARFWSLFPTRAERRKARLEGGTGQHGRRGRGVIPFPGAESGAEATVQMPDR